MHYESYIYIYIYYIELDYIISYNIKLYYIISYCLNMISARNRCVSWCHRHFSAEKQSLRSPKNGCPSADMMPLIMDASSLRP